MYKGLQAGPSAHSASERVGQVPGPSCGTVLTLMWFEDQPPVAYGEGLYMGKIHDSPSVVQELQHRYDFALGNALPLKESLALLRATARDYGHHG